MLSIDFYYHFTAKQTSSSILAREKQLSGNKKVTLVSCYGVILVGK